MEDQYTYKSEYKQNKVDIVNDVFAKVDEVVQEIKAVGPDDQKKDDWCWESGEVKKKLPADLTKELSDSNLLSLINADSSQLVLAKDAAVTAINSIMTEHIKMDELKDAKERYVSEMNSVNVDNGLKESIKALGRYAISANYFMTRS